MKKLLLMVCAIAGVLGSCQMSDKEIKNIHETVQAGVSRCNKAEKDFMSCVQIGDSTLMYAKLDDFMITCLDEKAGIGREIQFNEGKYPVVSGLKQSAQELISEYLAQKDNYRDYARISLLPDNSDTEKNKKEVLANDIMQSIAFRKSNYQKAIAAVEKQYGNVLPQWEIL